MREFKAKAYAAHTSSNTTDGMGGHDILIGYFKYETDAIEAGKGRGVMGTDLRPPHDIREEEIHIRIYDSFSEYQEACRDDARRRALSKLTYEEKVALGVLK